MTLHAELKGAAPDGLADAVAESLRDVCKLRGEVDLVAEGSLANDGKVIDDIRTFE
jgi:phenylacetate-CoA ligase